MHSMCLPSIPNPKPHICVKHQALSHSAFEALVVCKSIGWAKLQPAVAPSICVESGFRSTGNSFGNSDSLSNHMRRSRVQYSRGHGSYSSCAFILDAHKLFDDVQLTSVSIDDVRLAIRTLPGICWTAWLKLKPMQYLFVGQL